MSEQSHDPKTNENVAAAEETPTWTDPQTKLEWQFRSPGEMTWHDALEYARSLRLNGKGDWRLPTAPELETLLDRKILLESMRPAMRMDVPFRDTLSYWSSTTFAPDTRSAWIVMFDGAYILSYYKTSRYRIRCVRGSLG
ncbi:MAG: DUF1566 domain-containing protein [Acidobacteria bacterium]|nr:DUF1566 domain-containing protein [Acidobacteriota bacterium]